MQTQQHNRDWYLQTMGIQTYSEQLKHTKCVNNDVADDQSINSDVSQTWKTLKEKVAKCTACPLHQTRTQTVFGIGSMQAKLLFVGEAPGQQEDLKGEPFVGRAGQLLDQMLLAIGVKREDVYIANILKCRPPNNRDPKPEEQHTCTPFLLEQLKLLNPKLIISLGRISAHYLLQTNVSLSRLREQQHVYGDAKIPLLVTYHPAYLLRNPADKAKTWEDFLKIKQFI